MYKKLEEIVSIQTGSTIRGDYDSLAAGDYAVILPRHIKADNKIDFEAVRSIDFPLRSPLYLEAGHLLFSSKGSFKVSLYEGESYKYIASAAFFVMTVKTPSIVDPAYLREYLSSDYMRKKYRSMTDGATIPSISIKQFKEIEINIPPIEEQKKIAKIMMLHDDYRKLLEKKSELVAAQKNAIFKKLTQTGD